MPSEPLNVEANVTQPKNTTVKISWSAPLYRNGIITKYHIYHNKTTVVNKMKRQEIVRDITNETSYVVMKLVPYTKYSFWVRAETSAGIGKKSVTRTTTTDEGGNLLSLLPFNLAKIILYFTAFSSVKRTPHANCLKAIAVLLIPSTTLCKLCIRWLLLV